MNIIKTNLKFTVALTPLNLNLLDTIVLHHVEASHCSIEDIHRWHLEKGWAGCGYNYVIDKQGRIFEGRGMNIGAQCLNHNWHSIGISVEGCYNQESMPEVQKQSVIELCKDLKQKYPQIKHVVGHKELNSTDCPGEKYPLQDIKNKITNSSTVVKAPAQTLKRLLKLQKPMLYGEDIRAMQTILKRLGLLSKVDGWYGNNTKNAVICYQQQNKLVVDGIVGKNTWENLMNK